MKCIHTRLLPTEKNTQHENSLVLRTFSSFLVALTKPFKVLDSLEKIGMCVSATRNSNEDNTKISVYRCVLYVCTPKRQCLVIKMLFFFASFSSIGQRMFRHVYIYACFALPILFFCSGSMVDMGFSSNWIRWAVLYVSHWLFFGLFFSLFHSISHFPALNPMVIPSCLLSASL